MSSINHIFVYIKYNEKKIILRGKQSFDTGIMFMTSLHSPSYTLKYKGRLNNLRGRGRDRVCHQLTNTHFNDFFSTYDILSEEGVLSYNTSEKHPTDRCRLGVTNLNSTPSSLKRRVRGVKQTAVCTLLTGGWKGEGVAGG